MSTYISVEKDCPAPEPFGDNIWKLTAITSLFFLSFLGQFVFAPLMPTIEKDLGITHAQAGSLFLMISVGSFISQMLSGHLSFRINHRGSLFVSKLLLGLPLLWLLVDSSLLSLRVVMLIVGMGVGLHIPSAIATITAMVDRNDWGKALGLHEIAPPLGMAIVPFLVVVLLNYLAWQHIIAIIAIIVMAPSFIFYRFCDCGNFPGDPPVRQLLFEVLRLPSFWIMVVLFALFFGGVVGLYTMYPLYLIQEAGMSADQANSLVGLSRLTGLIGVFISGLIMDRIGEKKHIFLFMGMAGLATILIGTTSGVALMVMIFIQAALINCFPAAGFSALSRTVQPHLRSVVTSFASPIAIVIGGGIVPTLLGFMGENYSFSTGIIVMGCLMLVSPFLVLPLRLLDVLGKGC
jgi:MFS transporter, NNP family, nitrate/nitrite transporter